MAEIVLVLLHRMTSTFGRKLSLQFPDVIEGSETVRAAEYNPHSLIQRIELYSRHVHLDMNPGPPLPNYCSIHASHFEP